jgi:outer membrane protein OmpA-like peptidoglycan-associated protein
MSTNTFQGAAMHCRRALLTSLALGLTLVSHAVAVERRPPALAGNVLNMNEGTVVMSYTGAYGDAKWSGLHLFDGDPKSSWCSQSGKAKTSEFVVELPTVYELDKIAIDTSDVQEPDYPGISAKTVEVWGSTESARDGYKKLGVANGVKKGWIATPLPGKPKVQWLKFFVTNNWGHKEFTEITEIEAFGRRVGTPVYAKFDGIYSSNWGPIKLQQNGTFVAGCYTHQQGTIRGVAQGRTLRFDWAQKGNGNHGTALMVLSQDGSVLNGVWYTDGVMRGDWLGTRDDSLACSCETSGITLADRLNTSRRAILYGIYFDTNSDLIKPESQPALTELLQALQEKPAAHVLIEGHTDSTNTDQYNLILSQKRAQAVINWLVRSGIAKDRLTARGFGESKPVADNNTLQGRALNRRVEVSLAK